LRNGTFAYKRTPSKWTTGITVKHKTDPDLRPFLFELDREHTTYAPFVIETLRQVFAMTTMHCTGNGIHFYNLPLMKKEAWKELHKLLKHVNPMCPMTTLRIQPNKYENEESVWYNGYIVDWQEREAAPLNKHMLDRIITGLQEEFETVRYPLPK
jgi:hypothetical protein